RGLGDSPEKLLYRQIFLDTAQLAKIVMAFEDVDAERVAATGMSQGGGLALACAALEPRIRLTAPVAPFLCDYLRVWEIDLARDGYAQLQEYFRRFDPLHERHDELFTKLGYIDVAHLCPRIRADVLLSVGLMDTVCPPSTQFAAYNRIQGQKSTLIYPDFGHEIPPGNADRVLQFLRTLCPE
ncbi:MAG: acetylxylan esterase, partial [Nannocystaceae bacterium]